MKNANKKKHVKNCDFLKLIREILNINSPFLNSLYNIFHLNPIFVIKYFYEYNII